MNYSENSHLRRLQIIADYQFGRATGPRLLPEGCTFIYSRSGQPRQVLFEKNRLATLRASDGRLTLGISGALRLHDILKPPSFRVTIQDDVAEYIMRGKNAFARHVTVADPEVRAGDEVMVVDGTDRLLATGSAVLSGQEMMAFKSGVAVLVRQGIQP
jgi:conserved protein with predicted RNA binding PUA domain